MLLSFGWGADDVRWRKGMNVADEEGTDYDASVGFECEERWGGGKGH